MMSWNTFILIRKVILYLQLVLSQFSTWIQFRTKVLYSQQENVTIPHLDSTSGLRKPVQISQLPYEEPPQIVRTDVLRRQKVGLSLTFKASKDKVTCALLVQDNRLCFLKRVIIDLDKAGIFYPTSLGNNATALCYKDSLCLHIEKKGVYLSREIQNQ